MWEKCHAYSGDSPTAGSLTKQTNQKTTRPPLYPLDVTSLLMRFIFVAATIMDGGQYPMPPGAGMRKTPQQSQMLAAMQQQQQQQQMMQAAHAPPPLPESAFTFEGPEGQAPTSILATGAQEHITSISSTFTGSDSQARGATMQETFIQVSSRSTFTFSASSLSLGGYVLTFAKQRLNQDDSVTKRGVVVVIRIWRHELNCLLVAAFIRSGLSRQHQWN